MMPTIRPAEAVIVEPATATNVKNIAFYQTERGVIGHRLVRIANRNGKLVLLARGDADKGASEPVALDQILGRLVAVERNGRCRSRRSKGEGETLDQDPRIAVQTPGRPPRSPGAQIGIPLQFDRSRRGWVASTSQRRVCRLSERW
jgi:hypothetical protein